MAQSVLETPTSRKAAPTFYAQLDDVSGVLCLAHDTGAMAEVTSVAGLVVHGASDLCDAQALCDVIHAGTVAMGCNPHWRAAWGLYSSPVAPTGTPAWSRLQ